MLGTASDVMASLGSSQCATELSVIIYSGTVPTKYVIDNSKIKSLKVSRSIGDGSYTIGSTASTSISATVRRNALSETVWKTMKPMQAAVFVTIVRDGDYDKSRAFGFRCFIDVSSLELDGDFISFTAYDALYWLSADGVVVPSTPEASYTLGTCATSGGINTYTGLYATLESAIEPMLKSQKVLLNWDTIVHGVIRPVSEDPLRNQIAQMAIMSCGSACEYGGRAISSGYTVGGSIRPVTVNLTGITLNESNLVLGSYKRSISDPLPYNGFKTSVTITGRTYTTLDGRTVDLEDEDITVQYVDPDIPDGTILEIDGKIFNGGKVKTSYVTSEKDYAENGGASAEEYIYNTLKLLYQTGKSKGFVGMSYPAFSLQVYGGELFDPLDMISVSITRFDDDGKKYEDRNDNLVVMSAEYEFQGANWKTTLSASAPANGNGRTGDGANRSGQTSVETRLETSERRLATLTDEMSSISLTHGKWLTVYAMSAEQTMTATQAPLVLANSDGHSDGALELSGGGIKCKYPGAIVIIGVVQVTTGFTANDLLHTRVQVNGANKGPDIAMRKVSTSSGTLQIITVYQAAANDVIRLTAWNATAARGKISNGNSTRLTVAYL